MTYMETLALQEQIVREAVAWAKISVTEPQRLADYADGLLQGVSTLAARLRDRGILEQPRPVERMYCP
jgi:hypothetical protein